MTPEESKSLAVLQQMVSLLEAQLVRQDEIADATIRSADGADPRVNQDPNAARNAANRMRN